jgi:hypothetical protein
MRLVISSSTLDRRTIMRRWPSGRAPDFALCPSLLP